MLLSLDSSAAIKWVLQEQGWKAVDRVIHDARTECILAGPALTEVIFRARARGNVSPPEQIATVLGAQGIRVEPALEADLLRAAQLLETSAAHPGTPNNPTDFGPTLSLGDATILAVSERLEAVVLTGDRYWEWMVDQGLLSVKVHTIP